MKANSPAGETGWMKYGWSLPVDRPVIMIWASGVSQGSITLHNPFGHKANIIVITRVKIMIYNILRGAEGAECSNVM